LLGCRLAQRNWLYGYEIGWAFAAILDSALTKVEGDLEVGDFYRAQTLLAILTEGLPPDCYLGL
jgi:hypothetical protein